MSLLIADWSMYQARYIGTTAEDLFKPEMWVVDFDWDTIAASDLAGVIIRVGIGLTKDPCFDRYLAGLKRIGMSWGIYHAYWPTAPGPLQAAHIKLWCPQRPPLGVWGDIEAGNANYRDTSDYLAALDQAYAHLPTPQVRVKTGVYSGGPYLNAHFTPSEQAALSERRLWIAGYPHFIPPAGWNKGADYFWHQFTDQAMVPGVPRACDMSELNIKWKDQFGTDIGAALTVDPADRQIPLGPHHLQGGSTAGPWQLLHPKVSKAVDDLGVLSLAPADTLTVGRCNDYGLLAGQGFDVNRYLTQDHAQPGDVLRNLYIPFLLPKIQLNPQVLAWEGPNEQILTTAAAVAWYGEFSYLFTAWLNTLGKRAAVGSWASGTPDPSLWPSWTRGLQASRDFGALQAYHSYSDDANLAQITANQAAWAALGFAGCTHFVSECGANQFGGGWKKSYGTIDAYWAQSLRPFVDAIVRLPYPVLVALYTDGTAGDGAWDGLNVSDTKIVQLVAGYQFPEDAAMPITQAEISALKSASATLASDKAKLDALISSLVPDDLTDWWDKIPQGVLAQPITYAAQPKGYSIYDGTGRNLGIGRTNGGTIYEREGDLLRVTQQPVTQGGPLWWVKAEEITPPAG